MLKIRHITTDIRFWIILFFIIRLYGITNPPIEVSHNWRQTTVTMPARNYLEVDNNILYPRVDFAGEKTGITGMEFPLLNYLIYLMSLVFGYAHWYGRLINLIVSSIGLYFFYLLVKKYFTKTMAFNATFILLFSIWFTFSRKIMPDTFSTSLIIIGIYFCVSYVNQPTKYIHLLLYFLFTLMGLLSKLPSGCLLAALMPVLIQNREQKKAIFLIVAFSVLAIAISAMYYFYWVPYLTNHFAFEHFFMGKNIVIGAREVFQDFNNLIQRIAIDAIQVIAFVLFVIGLVFLIIKREFKLCMVFLFCLFSFSIVVFKAGFTFTHHSYYMVPFAPVMALVAAYVFENINNRSYRRILLFLILTESIANKWDDFIIPPNALAILNLEKELNKISKKDELIVINSGSVPTPMYFAHRKGWVTFNERLSNTEVINDYKMKGLRYIVIMKKVFGTEIPLPYKKVFVNSDFIIYEL